MIETSRRRRERGRYLTLNSIKVDKLIRIYYQLWHAPKQCVLFAIGIGYFLFAKITTTRELISEAIIIICGLLASERSRPVLPREKPLGLNY